MKDFAATASMMLLCGCLGYVAPWWIIAPVAFLVAAGLSTSAVRAFGAGFIGVAVLWGGLAGYSHFASQAILSARIAQMFGIGWPIVTVIFTALIGGLTAGAAALSGFYLKSCLGKEKI